MKADNKSIEIKTNIDQKELLELFHSASIYWHAAGYGIDEDKNPDAVEHLGITPLEGMAAGAVTMCHNSGGPRRYIKNNENGFLYDTIDELVATTIGVSDEMAQKISKSGRDYVRTHFSKEVFEKKVIDYFHL